MATNEIEGGSAAMETAVALQCRGGGSVSVAAVAAAWQQRNISRGSNMAGRAVAGNGCSLVVAARRWWRWGQRHWWQQQWWGAAIINNQQST
jgi:hypothetical protein